MTEFGLCFFAKIHSGVVSCSLSHTKLCIILFVPYQWDFTIKIYIYIYNFLNDSDVQPALTLNQLKVLNEAVVLKFGSTLQSSRVV